VRAGFSRTAGWQVLGPRDSAKVRPPMTSLRLACGGVSLIGPLRAIEGRRSWRVGSCFPSRRDRRLPALAHDSEATAMPVRAPLLRPATPGRRAALRSGRQDLPAVREAHGRPVRARRGSFPGDVPGGGGAGVSGFGCHLPRRRTHPARRQSTLPSGPRRSWCWDDLRTIPGVPGDAPRWRAMQAAGT
jgi:hypothetical protein